MLISLYNKLIGKKQKSSNTENNVPTEEEVEDENSKEEEVFTLTQVVSGNDSADTTFHECTQVRQYFV